MASYHQVMIHEIHVLLVDHDSEGLLNTAKLLEICQYRVTFVELASAAISMLLSGKVKFDVVMANVNSPDLHGFKLLQQAVTMGLPVILMSVDDNAFMAMRALENGALLFLKKPATIDMLRCLWQHVLRERMRLMKERDLLMAANVAHGAQGIRFREATHPKEENPNNVVVGGTTTTMKNNGKYRKYYGGRHGWDEEGDQFEFEKYTSVRTNVRRKMCTEWTHELHAKFMDAVEQLGEGRCFPKEILELMNVPGLTRMQVASHLQKCRNDNWRSPEERKSSQSTQPTSTDTNGSQAKTRRFGSKPQLSKPVSGRVNLETGQGSEINSEVNNNNNNLSHYQHYGSFGHGPSNLTPGANSSSKHRKHSSEEFFNLPDMDCLIQNLPGPQQGAGLNDPNPGTAGIAYNFNLTADYHVQVQNSGGQSMDTKSHWSSDTSNFESDHSENGSHE